MTRKELTQRMGGFSKAKIYAPNHITEVFENGEMLTSYGILVAAYIYGRSGFLFTDSHDYSKTTSKYVTRWTGMTTAERRKALNAGTCEIIVD